MHHPHHRLPYATSYPYGAFGGCFFNGFTSVCGYNPFFYGGYGANYCFSSFGFWNCGYGGYGTGFYGLNSYGPGPGYGYDVNAYPADASSDSPNNSYRMDPSDAYIPQAGDNAGQNPSEAAPRTPPTELIFKNGSAYAVTAYWVSGGEIYYRPVTGGLDHVPVDQLDLAATVEANARNGVTFQLTDHEPEP